MSGACRWSSQHPGLHIGTSYGYASKGFEKDKNIMNKIRQEPFFKEVLQHVQSYIKSTDLLIAGTKTTLSSFESLNDYKLKIKGRIIGSYNDNNHLFAKVRLTHLECQQHEIQTLLDSLGRSSD